MQLGPTITMQQLEQQTQRCCEETPIFEIQYESKSQPIQICQEHWNRTDELTGMKYFQNMIIQKRDLVVAQ